MYKSKVLISFLTGLLVLGQTTPIFATSISDDLTDHQDTSNNHADWDNIEYGGTQDDSHLSPDYYPEDHEIYGGFPGTRDEGNGTGGKGGSGSNGGSNGNGGSGSNGGNSNGGFDEIIQKSKYKIKNNSCYLTMSSTINGGKEKTTEKKVDMHLCLAAGGTVGQNNGEGSVGNIDLSDLIIYPSAPGEGSNVQDVADVIGESDAKEAESSVTYEIVYDKDGNVIGVIHKESEKEYKVGEEITLPNGVVIGVVNPDGTIDSSVNEYLQGENGFGSNGKVSNIKNDFDGLGKDTHGLYYTLDKSRGDSSLIYLDIKIKEDKTITKEEFITALTTVANANNGKVIEDEGRTLFFLEGKLMMTLNPTENVNVDVFSKLFSNYDSGIFIKPIKK